jgi:arginyl-tRNA synthetase
MTINHNDPMEYFRDQITELLAPLLSDSDKPINIALEIPPKGMGDFTYSCFHLAPVRKKNPEKIAQEIFESLPFRPDINYEVKGPYINFYVSDTILVEKVVDSVFNLGLDYGNHSEKGMKIILEHTSANPTDKLHVGRARNPIIGDTLARVLRSAGYEVETQYYVDDMGKQTARKILEARYERDWDRSIFKTGYQWATSATTVDSEHFEPEKATELDEIMNGLERGEQEILKEGEEICKKMMEEIIIPSLDKINVKIDNYVNESKFMLDNSVAEVIEKLKNSEYYDIEDGAYYIDLSHFDLKSGKTKFFFVRADGKSLYATRDIAYHHWKFKHCDVAINILGEDHKLETEYVRVGLDLTGSTKAPETVFYAFVNLPEGRMSTREGKVIYMDDLVVEAIDLAKTEVEKRREDLTKEKVNEIAEIVGIGAVRFNIIRVQAEKKIVFKWEDALNFEGDSAPFAQYAHARACSIIRKAEESSVSYSQQKFQAEVVTNPYELELVRTLGKLPGIIIECAKNRAAHTVASYAHDTAAVFNQFYRECPVLQAETPELIQTRLGLVDATRIVIRNTLNLLGISAPEMM